MSTFSYERRNNTVRESLKPALEIRGALLDTSHSSATQFATVGKVVEARGRLE